jgi:transcriptional regulator with XRE-family HTH domain
LGAFFIAMWAQPCKDLQKGRAMSVSALSGSKLRAKRISLGLRQGDVARAAAISASYLNLIEHNRRRVPPDVLARLADVLGDAPAAFADGGGGAILDDLRAVALASPSAEIVRVDEFAQRFPGWAEAVLSLYQRNLSLEGAIAALNDRISHDPHLSANLHEVLSAVSSVRSTTVILAETEDLEPEWRARFLRNLDQDSARLAKGAEALVRYLDSGGQIDAEGTTTPQEEVEAWAARHGWDLVDKAMDSSLSVPARQMAQALQAGLRADVQALPEAAYRAAVLQHGPDPLAIAAACHAPPFAAFRRLAFDGASGLGLVACDASGTLVLRRPAPGFSIPRFSAACPLWPLFGALGRPMQPIEARVEWGQSGPSAPRFLLRAFGMAEHPMGFSGPELRRAMMLIIPLSANDAAKPGLGPGLGPDFGPDFAPDFGVGSTCRICPREGCSARREPSIMAAAPDLATRRSPVMPRPNLA